MAAPESMHRKGSGSAGAWMLINVFSSPTPSVCRCEKRGIDKWHIVLVTDKFFQVWQTNYDECQALFSTGESH